MHKLYRPDETPGDYSFDEYCPHCDNDIAVEIDNDCSIGCYVTTCPVCGNTLRLCNLCQADFEESEDIVFNCDWNPANGCFRDKEVC